MFRMNAALKQLLPPHPPPPTPCPQKSFLHYVFLKGSKEVSKLVFYTQSTSAVKSGRFLKGKKMNM